MNAPQSAGPAKRRSRDSGERETGGYSCLTFYRCVSCGTEYPAGLHPRTCAACGDLRGTLDACYDLARAQRTFRPEALRDRKDRTLWRYHEILPVTREDAVVPLPVGGTPLYPLDCGEELSLPARVYLKDDTRNPSGSSKDRASALAVAHARETGAALIAAASTGNAASSCATLAARGRLGCVIFAPASAPPAKLVQIRAHGALLLAVEGDYDSAFDLCNEICTSTGMYNRNTATNPVLGEGKKTAALEIWEQLGYRAPDRVVVPVGDGCILGGVDKGFRDLFEMGLIPHRPRLLGVQAEGSSVLARAWEEGADACSPGPAATVADSLSVRLPRDQVKALRAVRESGGALVRVSDEEILGSASLLARRAGVFAEPAAAASLAGLIAAVERGVVSRDEECVLLITGHGLKDIASAGRAAEGNPAVSVGDAQTALAAVEEWKERNAGRP